MSLDQALVVRKPTGEVEIVNPQADPLELMTILVAASRAFIALTDSARARGWLLRHLGYELEKIGFPPDWGVPEDLR